LSADVDRRSGEQRRFAELYDALAAEFPDGDAVRLREIALLRFQHERAQAAGTCSLEDTVRIYNVIERKERALRAAARQRASVKPSIMDEIIARHQAKASSA